MSKETKWTVACLMLVSLAGAGILMGCSVAESKPLEVTYYYLPG